MEPPVLLVGVPHFRRIKIEGHRLLPLSSWVLRIPAGEFSRSIQIPTPTARIRQDGEVGPRSAPSKIERVNAYNVSSSIEGNDSCAKNSPNSALVRPSDLGCNQRRNGSFLFVAEAGRF